MTTRFRTTGDLPAGTWTGKQLSAGEADGIYYAVPRTEQAKSTWSSADFLTDNVGGTSSAWNGATLPTGVTTNSTSITVNISGGTTATWSTPLSNTRYVAVNKTVVLTAGGFAKTYNLSADIYFINCNIIINGAVGWAAIALGAFPSAFDATARTASYLAGNGSIGANGGMMFWGCTFNVAATNSFGIAPSEMIGCTFSDNMAKSGAVPLVVAMASQGRYKEVDFSSSPAVTGELSAWSVYGVPDLIENTRYFYVGFGNLVNSSGDNSLLITSPQFEDPSQAQFYSQNVATGFRPILALNATCAAVTGEGWAADNGTGSTYSGTWKWGWGGGSGQWTRAQDGLIMYQSIKMEFQDFDNNGIKNVLFRTNSNWNPDINGSNLRDRLRVLTTTNQNLIQEFITQSDGLLYTNRLSQDGGATILNNAYLNSLSGLRTVGTVQNSDWNRTQFILQSAGTNTPILAAQLMRMTGLNTISYTNTTNSWSARSFTHNFVLSGSQDYSNTDLINTQLTDLGGVQRAIQNESLKAAAIAAMNASNDGIIDTYFDSVFTGSTNNDIQDIYAVARYTWYRYTGVTSTATGALLPTVVNMPDLDFGSDDITTNSAFASFVGWTANAWTFKTQVVTGSATIFTTGTVTLGATSLPATAGTYVEWNAGIVALTTPATVRLNLTTTKSINNLLTTGSVAENATLNFGTLPGSAISMTGNLTFTNCVLSGILTLTPGALNRAIQFTNVDVTNLTLVNTNQAQIIDLINWTGGAVPAGFREVEGINVTATANEAGGRIDFFDGLNNLIPLNSGSNTISAGINVLGVTTTPVRWAYSKPGLVSRGGNIIGTAPYQIDISDTAATPAIAPAAGDVTGTFASGVLTLSWTASQITGNETVNAIEGVKGTQAFNQILGTQLFEGGTLGDLYTVVDSGSTYFNTTRIQFRSSPTTDQFQIYGVAVGPAVAGGFASLTADVTGVTGSIPQIINIPNPVAPVPAIVSALVEALDQTVTPDLTIINENVQDASLLIPATRNLT